MPKEKSNQTLVVNHSYENWLVPADELLSEFDAYGSQCPPTSAGKWHDASSVHSVSTAGSLSYYGGSTRRANGRKTTWFLAFVCIVSLTALSLAMLMVFGQINGARKCSCKKDASFGKVHLTSI